MFKKILIANRGEIAVRIIRTCREMGIKTVAVYSDADADSLHVKLADEAYHIGPAEAVRSYLDKEKILGVAAASNAEALHPGYGFLSENPDFVGMCQKRGVVFIGPPAESMCLAKPKSNARRMMSRINIPVVPGFDETITETDGTREKRLEEIAEGIGYPVIIKPAGGGGGIGMVVVRSQPELIKAVRSIEERLGNLFGISSWYIEKYLTNIKHVELQVLADKFGNVIHLGERDCSIQRRFQKLVEETPCHILPPGVREKMAAAAIDIARALKYVNALTIEFIYVPETQEYFFNEVNTRLQVEHCVTEMAGNIDIVKEQIKIAAGEPLSYSQDEICLRGYALECRITAEDVRRNFIPCPGTITGLRLPHGMGIRIDEGVYEGCEVPFYYDPLLLKVMTWGLTREEAIARMKRAITEMQINGVETTLPFHRLVLDDEVFRAGLHTTDYLERHNILGRIRGEA